MIYKGWVIERRERPYTKWDRVSFYHPDDTDGAIQYVASFVEAIDEINEREAENAEIYN